MYGVDVSPALVSKVTDGILEELTDWQNRPLDGCYPLLYIDAMIVKVPNQRNCHQPPSVRGGWCGRGRP